VTFKELINEVLIRLREDTISDWTGDINDASNNANVSDYHRVIASLVNDSKKHVESRHDWTALRETMTVATVAGTMIYTLGDSNTGAGSNVRIFDVINQKTGRHLSQVGNEWLNARSFPAENIATGEPTKYAINGSTNVSSTRPPDVNIDLYPVPTEVQNINFNIIKIQPNMKTSGEILTVPESPVILGAWARAISERGEDGGTQSSVAAQEANESIKQAIILDNSNVQYESDWYVV
jgi:hypothetical protein